MLAQQWSELDKKILLYSREVEGHTSPFWNTCSPFDEELKSYVSTKGEYVLWLQSKRPLVEQEIVNTVWVKTNPSGYTTEMHFYANGTLRDIALFDRATLTGRWTLNKGVVNVAIQADKHLYEFDIVGSDDNGIHSAVEFEDGVLSSYLKLFRLS
ncbi:hypothetical protein K6Y31_13020 [Motilimonas cestriensis]|uniref:Uncharacterized protein n=1 Tax=Motilimonas cestriensis TaxID=2742685 RepID=A0ABS8WB78_9GAMM|nr:hypothetical protein [Motilimonas cestriensis]MCE2595735.1 hypothetical protein [Motilimonas cestriensis]